MGGSANLWSVANVSVLDRAEFQLDWRQTPGEQTDRQTDSGGKATAGSEMNIIFKVEFGLGIVIPETWTGTPVPMTTIDRLTLGNSQTWSTEPFTISEPIGEFCVALKHRSTYFEALKLWNVRSGRLLSATHFFSFFFSSEGTMHFTPNLSSSWFRRFSCSLEVWDKIGKSVPTPPAAAAAAAAAAWLQDRLK